MKKLFEKKKKIIEQLNEVSFQLDREINNRWGFSYSETDDDSMIDTLDYGTQSISYKEFVRLMDKYKKNEETKGSFGCVI